MEKHRFAAPLASAFLLFAPAFAAPAGAREEAPVATAASEPAAFRVVKTGAGRPMIFLPGLLSSGEVWDGAVGHFSGRYECHVLTLAGFAGQPPLGDPFLPRVRDRILAYIDAEQLDRPILVGHSLGGFLAFWLAASAPDKVGPVVAVDGLPFLPARWDPAATAATAAPAAEHFRRLFGSSTPAQMAAQARGGAAAQVSDVSDFERAVAWAEASDPAATGQAMYELMTTDLREEAGAIRAPVLLVAALGGEEAAARERLRKLYEGQVAKVPQHRVVVAEKARHFVMIDDPDFLFAAIDAFLASPTAGRPAAR